ncbi:MAG: Mov34/MPN/PAD-1 family protein, partial [Actinobacteria bacterium]|nr:Mov34/MPN/PAD-1 family protein [Actinomycetota bacterium]
MIRITLEIVKKIFEQGKAEAPFEACGYLTGKNDRVKKYYPMTNVDKSEDHFSLDPKEQFEVLKEVRKEGFEILAGLTG